MFQANDIGMRIFDQLPHDLQLSILKPFILQNFLNCNDFPRLHDSGLENDTKRSIPNDSFSGIGNCLVCCGPVRIGRRDAGFIWGRRHLYLFFHHLFVFCEVPVGLIRSVVSTVEINQIVVRGVLLSPIRYARNS